MVVGVALVQIVAHAGVEDEVHALVQQVFDVAVSQLRRIAHRIRWDRMLSQVVHLTGALVGENCLKAQLIEQSVPEGHLLVEAQSQRQAYLSSRLRGL